MMRRIGRRETRTGRVNGGYRLRGRLFLLLVLLDQQVEIELHEAASDDRDLPTTFIASADRPQR